MTRIKIRIDPRAKVWIFLATIAVRRRAHGFLLLHDRCREATLSIIDILCSSKKALQVRYAYVCLGVFSVLGGRIWILLCSLGL